MRYLLSRLRGRSALGVALTIVLSTMFALGVTFLLPAKTSHAVGGAAFTTVDEAVDGSGHCQNGNPGVNCNIYDGKQFVWLNGGPQKNGLSPDGQYFFAVLDPSGQSNPNDGSTDLLSTDTHDNRTFTVSGGEVSAYTGTHDLDSGTGAAGSRLNAPDGQPPFIRLLPYNDTSNPGGVYILAICYLGNGYPVDPRDCKYDAFKVESGQQQLTDLVVTKDANPAFNRQFTWTIQKSVDKTRIVDSRGTATFNYTVAVSHDNGTDSGWQVTGTIQVLNPNNQDFTGVNVADAINDTNATCLVTGGSGATIPANSSADFPYTCTYSAAPASKQETNTATATWDPNQYPGTSGSASFNVDFMFDTGSAGNPTLIDNCVTVTDTLAGTLGTVCSTDPSPTTFTYSHTVTGTPGTCVTQNNTATFTTNTTGTTGSASQSVQMCTPVDLKVTKNATPGFTRTYNWKIAKSADKTLIEQIGGTATVTYTVTVTQTGHTDSGWQATGKITLTNPNDFFDFTGVNVTDAVDDGGSCIVTGGTNVTVPAGKSVDLDYTCTYASQPAYNATATNTATATWDGASFETPDSTGSGKAQFTFNDGSPGNPNEVNKCVTVTDTFAGTLGTDCVGTDPAVKTFTYQRTFTVPTFNCVTNPNTATLVETGQTASASVEVCGPAKTGALTMGFWQNKNGQGIITGGSSTGGVCNSGTWLRQYAPFQDLSATATCSTVATYVFNVIKAATCGGSTCNAMLKAQMLATALDVYFSDPALGGNKISAPAPIGGVKIDLTKICQMIDSGGSGSCNSTFENVSSAFGGAGSLTILQMLTYAASQSNAGGSIWYGNVKATQVLAKDAFDAINNQVAFAP